MKLITSFLKNALFNSLSLIIVLVLFVVFGLILYYDGYSDGIEKATAQYNKQKNKLLMIIDTPCEQCKVYSKKYNDWQDKVLKKVIEMHDFNEHQHTTDEYKQFIRNTCDYYFNKKGK